MEPFRNLRQSGKDQTFEQVRYEPADPVIEDVRFDPPSPESGETVQLEVDVRDTKSTATGGSDFNAVAVLAETPTLSQHILARCEVIEPGNTLTIDDSTGDQPGYDGEFPATETMDITIYAVGFSPSGSVCEPDVIRRQAGSGYVNPSVQQTVTLEVGGPATEEPSVTPTDITVAGDSFQTGDTVIVDATFENTGGPGEATTRVGVGPRLSQLEQFSEGGLQFEAGETRTERYQFDLPPESGDWDVAAAYVTGNQSGAVTTNISVASPNFDQDVQVVNTSWSPSGSATEGQEVTRSITIENQGDVPYRVSVTFTDSDGGNQIGAATIMNLQPGDSKVVEQTVVAEPPEVTVCYSLAGQATN